MASPRTAAARASVRPSNLTKSTQASHGSSPSENDQQAASDENSPATDPNKQKRNKKNKKDEKRAKKIKPASPTIHLLRSRSERRPDLCHKALESERIKEHAMAGCMQLQRAQVQTVELERDAAFQRAHLIMQANEHLERQLALADRDVQDVVTSLKNGVQQKEQIRLAVEADVRKVESNKQRVLKGIDETYAQTIRKLKLKMAEKNSTPRQMNRDFHQIEEHHRHRHHVQEMLENIRQTIYKREKKHREVLNDMERRFLQERQGLQTEACKRLTMFGEKSYEEAVKNIDTQTRQVFIENNSQAAELELCLARTKKLSERVVILNNAVEQVSQQQTIETETMQAMRRMEHQHTHKQADLEQQTIALRATLQSAIDQLHSRYAQLQRYYAGHIQQRDGQISVLQTAISRQTSERGKLLKRQRALEAQRRQVECFLLDVMTEAERHAREDGAAATEKNNKHFVAKTLLPLRQQTSNFTTRHYPVSGNARSTAAQLQHVDQPLPDGPTAAARNIAGMISHTTAAAPLPNFDSNSNNKTDFSQLSWHDKSVMLRSLYLYVTKNAVRRARQHKQRSERQTKADSRERNGTTKRSARSTSNDSASSRRKEQLCLENQPTTASATTSPTLPSQVVPTEPLFLSDNDNLTTKSVRILLGEADTNMTAAPDFNQAVGNNNGGSFMNDAKAKLDLLLKRVEEDV